MPEKSASRPAQSGLLPFSDAPHTHKRGNLIFSDQLSQVLRTTQPQRGVKESLRTVRSGSTRTGASGGILGRLGGVRRRYGETDARPAVRRCPRRRRPRLRGIHPPRRADRQLGHTRRGRPSPPPRILRTGLNGITAAWDGGKQSPRLVRLHCRPYPASPRILGAPHRRSSTSTTRRSTGQVHASQPRLAW